MTPTEAAKWVPALQSFDLDLFCAEIYPSEESLFGDCISFESRDAMILNAVDFSQCKQWSEDKVYALNEIVEFNGYHYKSKIASNSDIVGVNASWEIAKYFVDTNYNELWEKGMARWIALTVLKAVMPFNTYKIAAKGTTKIFEDSGERTVDTKEYYVIIRSLENQINQAKFAMMRFYKKTYQTSVVGCGENETECADDYDGRVAF